MIPRKSFMVVSIHVGVLLLGHGFKGLFGLRFRGAFENSRVSVRFIHLELLFLLVLG